MIEEIAGEVCAKTGLSQEQAQAAVTATIGFLQSRLPEPLSGALAGMLGGAQPGAGGMGAGGIEGELEGICPGKDRKENREGRSYAGSLDRRRLGFCFEQPHRQRRWRSHALYHSVITVEVRRGVIIFNHARPLNTFHVRA